MAEAQPINKTTMKVSTPRHNEVPYPHDLINYLECENNDVITFVKLSAHATIPTRATVGSAGMDLYACQNTTILPGNEGIIKTDLQVQLPEFCYGRIAPRSGLAWTHCIDVLGGVIDPDFRGNLTVMLFNHGITPCVINRGDRIAQLICEKFLSPIIVEDNYLTPTARGKAGFGSSGN